MIKQMIENLIHEKYTTKPGFLSEVSSELAYIAKNLQNDLPIKSLLLSEIVNHIFCAGGKRIRPALCFLIAKGTGSVNKKHFILAELTELIHTASLIHDDIIDSAKLRRGVETINSLWNNKLSVIAGDYLFAQASVRLGMLENNEIVKIYANVLSDLCDGEIEQYTHKFKTDISWDDYINKSIAKTASLFSAICKSTAIINNLAPDSIYKAESFGKFLGIAFQIKDDLLDFTSSVTDLGKEVCSDLKEGIITAPTLYALKSSDNRKQQLKLLIENRFNNDPLCFDQAIRLVLELGGCEKAEELANKYIADAKKSLTFISDVKIKEYLYDACDFILNRN